MDDSALSGGTITAPAPGNPGLDAARAELTDIATNPENPRYAGYQRGDKQVMDHLDAVYRKAAPHSKPVSLGEYGLSIGPAEPMEGETPEQAEVRQRNDVILAPLKQEWGADFDSRYAQARATACTLFENRTEMLDELGTIVRMQYGPKGEAATLKYFAHLEAIKQGGSL
jgi:hypothetical protein